jgi:hypothetical protein
VVFLVRSNTFPKASESIVESKEAFTKTIAYAFLNVLSLYSEKIMKFQNLMQPSNEAELLEEELNSVVGDFGWDDIKKVGSGYVRYLSGELDGATESSREHKDLPYRAGYRVGQVANIVLQAIG